MEGLPYAHESWLLSAACAAARTTGAARTSSRWAMTPSVRSSRRRTLLALKGFSSSRVSSVTPADHASIGSCT